MTQELTKMAKEGYYPLFETRRRKGRLMYRVFSFSLLIGIWSIWVYRLSYIPKEDGKWVWIGLLCAELWFGFYWFLRQALRWNPIFRQPFPERLTQRYIHYICSRHTYLLYIAIFNQLLCIK